MPALGHVATLTCWLHFSCRRYRTDSLLERFGSAAEMHVIIDALAADCPRFNGMWATAALVAPVPYRIPANLNDITLGNNNGFEVGPGRDPATGLGSPKGDAIAAILSEASVRS